MFVPSAADRWPLTPRTRFALWLSMYQVVRTLHSDLIVVLNGAEVEETEMMCELPAASVGQSAPWWGQLLQGGYRMVGALAHGDRDVMEPRTPGEEALVYLAIEWAPEVVEEAEHLNAHREGQVAWETANGTETWRLYQSLPSAEELPLADELDEFPDEERGDLAQTLTDFDWPDVLPDLTGDADIELAFNPAADGITDPTNPINQYLAIGDYRLEAWNTPFPRVQRLSD